MAKFGIALGSGPRGREFKSRHSDHTECLLKALCFLFDSLRLNICVVTMGVCIFGVSPYGGTNFNSLIKLGGAVG